MKEEVKNELMKTGLRYLVMLAFAFILISSVSAYKVGERINITQGCSGSTYANISQIAVDGKLLSNNEIAMIKSGISYSYTYTPNIAGTYYVLTHCDENGVDITAPQSFEVTYSGKSNSQANTVLFVIVILLIYTVSFIGFFGKNEWVTILGGMGMITLGIYTINNGLIIYKDFITNVFSWTTIGVGAFFSLMAAIEIIEENVS